MVARAPDEQRIASLITTGQAVLAVMRRDQAIDLYRQQGAYQDYQGGILRALVAVDDHIVVTSEHFPRHHAWLVTSALVENDAKLDVQVATGSADGDAVPTHEGALAFARGEPLEIAE